MRKQAPLAYITYTQFDGAFTFPPVPADAYDLYLGNWSTNATPLQVIQAYGETQIRLHVALRLAERIYIPFIR